VATATTEQPKAKLIVAIMQKLQQTFAEVFLLKRLSLQTLLRSVIFTKNLRVKSVPLGFYERFIFPG